MLFLFAHGTGIVHKPSELKYVFFSAYSAVSNGIGSFKSMEAKAVVDNQMGQKVTLGCDDISVSHVEK